MKSNLCLDRFGSWVLAALLSAASLTSLRAHQFEFDPGDLPDGFPEIPGGLPGGIPPFLPFSNPAIGAQNVGVDTLVSFTFSAPMDPAYAVTWSPNVTPGNFTYSWSADGTVLSADYSGDFPTSATITWTLDPTVFKDKVGEALLPFNNSGSFTTGSGQSNPNDPCDPGSTNSNGGSLFLSKSVQYVQTSANPPEIDPEIGATFMASLVAPKANPASEATVELPDGTVKALTNTFGQFFAFDQFATQADLDTAYPSGTYKVTVKFASGTSVLNLNLGAAGAPPTPQISNYPQTQAFNPAADFNLQWLQFTGAAQDDSLYLELHDEAGNTFSAPDPCVPRELPVTATSIVIPANTLATGGTSEGSLAFNRMGGFDTNSVPNLTAFASYSKSTRFEFKSTGETPTNQVQILNLSRQRNGTVQFQVQATAGAILMVEGSDDLKVWTPVATGPAVLGRFEVTDAQAATAPQRFYRARTL